MTWLITRQSQHSILVTWPVTSESQHTVYWSGDQLPANHSIQYTGHVTSYQPITAQYPGHVTVLSDSQKLFIVREISGFLLGVSEITTWWEIPCFTEQVITCTKTLSNKLRVDIDLIYRLHNDGQLLSKVWRKLVKYLSRYSYFCVYF